MKRIKAIYRDSLYNISDHLSWPTIDPLKIFRGSFVLYEIDHRPWYKFFRLTTERKFEVFSEKTRYAVGNEWKGSDIFIDLIQPWLEGANLKYLEDRLTDRRNQLWPKNNFIYTPYDEQTSVPTHT